MTRAVLVTVAWLVAVAASVGLLVAASAGTVFTADDTNFSVIFVGLALAVATEASDEFDLGRFASELGSVVGRTLAPREVGGWLRPSIRIAGR